MTFELHRTRVVDPSVLTMEEERPVRVRSREGELLSCTPKAARSAGTLRHMMDNSAGGSCPVDVPAVALRVVLDASNDVFVSAFADTHRMPLPLAVSTGTRFRLTSSRAQGRLRRLTSRARGWAGSALPLP